MLDLNSFLLYVEGKTFEGREFQSLDVRGKNVESKCAVRFVQSWTEYGCCLAIRLVTRVGAERGGTREDISVEHLPLK